MPRVQEIACKNDDCNVDMFSIHYTSYVADEDYIHDYSCPSCGDRSQLQVLGGN